MPVSGANRAVLLTSTFMASKRPLNKLPTCHGTHTSQDIARDVKQAKTRAVVFVPNFLDQAQQHHHGQSLGHGNKQQGEQKHEKAPIDVLDLVFFAQLVRQLDEKLVDRNAHETASVLWGG